MARVYRVIVQPRAIERLEMLERQGQRRALDEALHILELLEEQNGPHVDGIRKRTLHIPPNEWRTVYDGDLVWVQYHFIDNEIVSVLTLNPHKRVHLF